MEAQGVETEQRATDPLRPGSLVTSIPNFLRNNRERNALAEAGIRDLQQLVLRLPRRFEDRITPVVLPAEPPGHPIPLRGQVTHTRAMRLGRQRCTVLEVAIDPPDAPRSTLTCRWFGMPYLARAFPVDAQVHLFGTAKLLKGNLFMDHPEHEVIRADDPLQLGALVPIHVSPRGITTRDFRRLVERALDLLADCPDLLPPPRIHGSFEGWSRLRALREAHFPANRDSLLAAQRYLALEWLVGQQLGVLARRAATDRDIRQRNAPSRQGQLVGQLLASLPFAPTTDQQNAIHEIMADLRTPRPMNRLLHGDVGSGKTVVAAAAAVSALERGEQVALMAPTQILAEQHFTTLRQWLHPLGLDVSLRTSALREGSPTAAGIVVGTHALLHGEDEELDPQLVIIDEQHKFGVAQRERLIGRARNPPDVLVMTATPIPRTLVITAYGELDVSTLQEKPPGRSPIITNVLYGARTREVTTLLKEKLGKGQQAYLVFPRIQSGEQAPSSGKAPNLEEELPKWQKRLHPFPIGHVHGRMPLEEREATMTAFRNGEIAALLATTAIEVGVDVPNATMMVIFGAGRFGIAQLHQLRGRIGRGTQQAQCLLLADRDTPEMREKLGILETTEDGFQIAEADLARRGPGEILGHAQSGHGGLAALAEHLGDPDFCILARKVARKITASDPALEKSSNRELIRLASPVRTGEGSLQ